MLKSGFDMKGMGLVNVTIIMKIYRTSEGRTLSQPHYIKCGEEAEYLRHFLLNILRWPSM